MFRTKIEQRLIEFKIVGAVASDISLQCVYPVAEKESAQEVFAKRLTGALVSEQESQIFKGYLTYFLF